MPLGPESLTPLAEFSEDDLQEFVHQNPSQRTDRFSVEKADLDVVYKVPGTKLQGALMWLLGVDYVPQSDSLVTPASIRLKRTCPAFHPVHCWAWAHSVQVQGQGFQGDDTDAVIWEWQNTPAKWDHYVVTVSYNMPKYNVFYDESVNYEYERFLSKEFFPHTELVSIETGCILLDAPGTAWENKPPPGMQVAFRRETAGVKLIWHRVPLEFVQASDDELPLKLLQVQGRVNSGTFLGRPPETMLCKDIKLNKYVSPLLTNTIGQLYFMYDIEMDFIYYDPEPKGFVSTGAANGWNYHPAPNYKYYYGVNSGQPVYKSVDFDKIFTHHTDTITLT
jgi:hypothetical protein